MSQKLANRILFMMIILLAIPGKCPAKFFDELGERVEKKSKDTKKRMKEELDRTHKDLKKFTYKSKVKVKDTWGKHKDDIVPLAVTSAALYTGDSYLTMLALKKYGIINEDGKIEWRIILPDEIIKTRDKVDRSRSETSNHMIVLQADQNDTDQKNTGIIADQPMYNSIHQWHKQKPIE